MQGETRKIPPAAFVSFGAQKKAYSLLRTKGRYSCAIRGTLSMFSSCPGMLRIGRSSRGCSLKCLGVLKGRHKLPSPDMGVTDPLLAFGTPPPLGIGLPSPKMRD